MTRPVDEQLTQPGGLAERLYGLRQAAGLKTGQLADVLGWGAPKVSKLQRGQQRPTVADVEAWAKACGQPEATSELLDLLSEVDAVHWRWQQRLSRGQAAVQEDLDTAVRRATRIRSVQVAVLPGLLQTAAYARATIAMFHAIQGTPGDDVDATVAARVLRQDVLHEPGRSFEFVLTENILRRRVGGAEVMRGQLDRLLRLADLPHITLAIFPDDADDPAVFPYQGFLMLDDRVVLDLPSGEVRFAPEDKVAYERMVDAVLAESVTGGEAHALIAAASAALRDAPTA